MFGKLSDPKPQAALLRCGIACLALAGLSLSLLRSPLLAGIGALVGAGCLGAWGFAAWRHSREGRYDLRRLWDAPPPEPEEPLSDTIPTEEDAAPYCGWCDEAYAPDTYRCTRCGRPLA
jgi:hypothetical protein